MKKIGFTALMFFAMFLFIFPQWGQAAAGSTSIYLDGKALELPKNGEVQNVNGNVMIPIRVVVEELGFVVDWDKKTRTITIQQSDTQLKLVVGQSTALVNGTKVKLAAAPKLVSDTTIVPLRFVGEQMGLTVTWDNVKKSAHLITPNSGSGNGTGSGENAGGGNEEQTPDPVPDPTANLANVGGISFSDNRLMIAVDKNVKPSIFTMAGPDRIVIDLPNTKFADTFSNNLMLDQNQNGYFDVTEYPDVSKVRYALFDDQPSTIRVVLDMNYTKKYELINNNDGLIIVNLNTESTTPGTAPGGNGKKLVVIDAGHGGSDPGAISVTKKKEKDFNLAVVLKVQELLKQESDIDFVLTRSSDTYPTLQDRVKIANDLKADIFISVHANAGSATASGVETYYTRSESLSLAKVMHKYLVQSSGLSDRGVRSKSLHVTRETKMPAVLLECGYLSNKNDNAVLYTEDFQDRVAEGVVKGIKEYLGLN
ncbi:N-acetylmuramoyl-L-alanine amidase family protein [Paenibacillus vini]|uniref:N-acetylmuramoyl-L-alanine amidase family protein n=1 Tax=Paenibacillus vini TaxID=1476024 RepID=UPI0025B6BB70|nr:N-acetylmuramoyl-L-alanine amidase family protein [Paenibacillus vini]MDN4069133.1 N-acetylmuramoyl-L-alanine amidase family protein [Paenibacillus vini]